MPRKSTLKGARILDQRFEEVRVDLIKPHPQNPNKGDVDEIGASITDNGFYGACVVQRSSGYILVGNHRWEAAKAAGLAVVPVLWVDVDDDRADRIAAVDNRTAELGRRDERRLAALLSKLSDDTGLHGTGYDDDDLQALLERVRGPDPEPPTFPSQPPQEDVVAPSAAVSAGSTPNGAAAGNCHPRTATPSYLRWPGREVPLTPEEELALEDALDAWLERTGDECGFVASLLPTT